MKGQREETERQRILGRERIRKRCEFAVYFCHGRELSWTHPMIWISFSNLPVTCLPYNKMIFLYIFGSAICSNIN